MELVMVCYWFTCAAGAAGFRSRWNLDRCCCFARVRLAVATSRGGAGGCGSLLRRPFGAALLLGCWPCCVARGRWIAAEGGGSLIQCEDGAINVGCWLPAKSAVRG
ncbi:hypothetical protein AB3S75_019758 [Citrus x aurantiifolia]